jgi:hypothetical protein
MRPSLAAAYLINCLPTKVLNLSTPLEKLFKEKPNYNGLLEPLVVPAGLP